MKILGSGIRASQIRDMHLTSRAFANPVPITLHGPMEPAPKGIARMLQAARKSENIPYTILGSLALLSVVARLILILR